MPDDGKPTLRERMPASSDALDTLPGTMEMPSGAPVGEAPPLEATIRPAEGTTVPQGRPPAMPSEWRYDLGREIARGGMGRVVEATDTILGRTVALKEALALDNDSLRRFQRETRITARLEHPSIVPVHDAGFAPGGAPYYVMRKVTGRPLEELVAHADTLAKRLALLPHVVAAAHAIAHAHGRAVVHRDIKPSNILVGDNGETIVIDWGLAKVIGETEDSQAYTRQQLVEDDSLKTRVGVVFGTPGFMAPEQLRGAPVDEQCDIYALGATLYHMLARRPPHHAANGDAMMKAAVAGPPVPLAELVDGVPPELATIVDKALAFDPHDRYGDAASLAEDLNRFLTGQLVRSHHYSTRERIVRWVKRNRALVAVSGAALVAMIVGGTIAVWRIVNERDRADEAARIAVDQRRTAEQERERATDRADELTLEHALREADTDPTRAIAMIRPLAASSKWWPQVRAIAAKARAAGVAFGLPASARTLSLELGGDGTHLLATGDDGVVRVYDLAARAVAFELRVPGATSARFADDGKRVAIAHGGAIAIVDLTNASARRDVATATPIGELAVAGPIACWIDANGAAWTLDLGGDAPAKLALDEPVHALVPSPDARWIALAGADHLLLLDRAQPTLPPEAPVSGAIRELAWSADGGHLVLLVGDELVDVAMAGAPTIVQRFEVGQRRAVAFANGAVYTSGPTGVAIVRDRSRPRLRPGDYSLGLREAKRGVVVAGGAQQLQILSDDAGDVALHPPVAPLSLVEASPRSSFVVAAAERRVLAWDLDGVLPERVADGQPSSAAFVDGDRLVATFGGGEHALWIDLRAGTRTPVGAIANLHELAGAPDGARAIAIDQARRARVIAPGREPIELADAIEHARFVDDQRYVVATTAGAIRVVDGSATRELVPAGQRVVVLDARGTRIAAVFGDGSAWRGELASAAGAGDHLAASAHGKLLALALDGTVVIAAGTALHVWRADGTLRELGTFAHPIAHVAIVDMASALAITDDGSAYVARLDASDAVPVPAAGKLAWIARDGGLVVTTSAAGQLDAIDPVARVRWTLAAPHDTRFGIVQIAPDGKRALALGSPTGLLVWTLALPTSRDGAAAWLDATTNALDGGPSMPLGWR